MRAAFLMFVMVFCLIVIGFGLWQFKRWVNYNFNYSDQVEETVCEMVKSEALKVVCDEPD